MPACVNDDPDNDPEGQHENYDTTGDAFEINPQAPSLPSTDILAPANSSSTVIAGRYQLLKKIGQGGMGEVWIAQQTQPVKRRVAIKLIRPGMVSKAFIARFEQERQALAMMDHPNIAKVLDAGVAANGAPYLVMEYVNGEQLNKYCDSARLSPRDRLELFVPICQAVQHAHQKGIVHRDLKPANILVALVDGKPVPKVIDFGVAKATGGKLTNETLSTDFGAVVGTLEYMAPEQAGKGNEDIDTRADIYSLGVILYELLTGLRPLDGDRLRKAALSEMIRIIREDDPSRPSTRLSSCESLPSLAAMRQTNPSKLMAELQGELDWVVMKCLEKSRDRRYETANGLARDIERYLSQQPVEARPPTHSYRVKKFIARNRGSVGAVAVCLALFIAGFVGTALGLLEARRQTAVAVTKSEIAQNALLSETQAREAAEKANRQAFDALESFSDSLMEDLLGSKETLSSIDRAVLENAERQWTLFAESKGATREARVISAEGAKNLSKIQEKLGLNQAAEANNRKSLTIWESVAMENPNDREIQIKLAKSHQSLGAILRLNGSRKEAGQHFQTAAELFAKLVSDKADDLLEAEHANSCTSSGNSARDFGHWQEAERYYTMALSIQEKLSAQNPDHLSFLESAAGSRWALAGLYKRQDKLEEAEVQYRQTLQDYAALASADKRSREYRINHANLHRELGDLLCQKEDDQEAAEQLSQAVSSLASIAKEFPSVPSYRLNLGRAQRDYANVLGYLNQAEAAEDQFQQSIAIFQQLTKDDPANLPHQADHGITLRMCALFQDNCGKTEEALQLFGQAIQVLTAAYAQDPKITLTQRALCRGHEQRALTLDRIDRHKEALADWDQVLKLCEQHMLHIHRSQRVDSLLRSGSVEQAMQEIEDLAQVETPNPFHWFRFAKLYALASETLPARRDELRDQSIALLKKAINLGFADEQRLKEDRDLAPLKTHAGFPELAK